MTRTPATPPRPSTPLRPTQARKILGLATALHVVAAALTSAALMVPPAWAGGRLMEVQVFDRTQNRELPVYRHQGQLYVVGTPGNEYSVMLRNRTGADLLSVLSVDGVNAVSGQTAAPDQTGYVFAARQNAEIRGWRKDLERTAAFYFTSLADSYAARTGRPANVGVIGVAVFRRRVDPPPLTFAPRTAPPVAENQSAAGSSAARAQLPMPASPASPGSPAGAAPFSEAEAPMVDRARSERSDSAERRIAASPLGTGHGRTEFSSTQHTSFERASNTPDETITIFYDSRANLIARGIVPVPPPAVARAPQAFPGFVADPPAR